MLAGGRARVRTLRLLQYGEGEPHPPEVREIVVRVADVVVLKGKAYRFEKGQKRSNNRFKAHDGTEL